MTPVSLDTQNPFVIAAYVVGLLVSAPVITLAVKAIFFIAEATAKLRQIDKLVEDVADIKANRHDDSRAVELSLTIIESDLNVLQEKAGVPVRAFPDRRVGPADRRAP